MAQVRHENTSVVLGLAELPVGDGPSPYVLNGSAHEIWSLLDTPRTVSSIAHAMADRSGLDRQTLDGVVGSFIEELRSLGLICLER